MATKYCTRSDVKDTARQFSMDFDRNDPAIDSDIDDAIDEASDIARHLLEPRYDISVIDANIPEAVTSFTKLVSAKILLSAFGQVTGAKVDEQIERLSKRAKIYKKKIMDGALLNTDGTKIEANTFNSLHTQPFAESAISELFEGGTRG